MEYIEIGHVIKSHGLKGEMKILVRGVRKIILEKVDAVFIAHSGLMEPYFIEYTKGDDPLILKLEGIDKKEAINSLIKATIHVRKEMDWMQWLDKETNEQEGYRHLTGYSMQVHQLERIGKIVAVEQFPQQVMAFVIFDKVEYPIPLNDHFILEIDHEKKKLLVDLPEGLIE